MPFTYTGSHIQNHMRRLLRNCCNTELSRTVSHNFSFIGNAAIFSPEDGDSMFLRNGGIYLTVYTAPQPRIITSSSPPWEPQISPACWSTRNCLGGTYCMKPVSCNWFLLCMTDLSNHHSTLYRTIWATEIVCTYTIAYIHSQQAAYLDLLFTTDPYFYRRLPN
jgi:hypothetical protein